MNLTQKTDLELNSLMAWCLTISEIQFHGFCLEWLMGYEAWGFLGIDLAIKSCQAKPGGRLGPKFASCFGFESNFQVHDEPQIFSPESHRLRASSYAATVY